MGTPIDPNVEMRKFIGQTLVEDNLIAEHQLEEALTVQMESGTKTVETLIRLGRLDPTDFARLIAAKAQYTSVEPDHYFLPDEYCDLLPQEFADRYQVFPVGRLGRSILLAAAAPLNRTDLKSLEGATRSPVVAVHCDADTVRNAIILSYRNRKNDQHVSQQALARRIEMSLRLQNISHTLSTIETLPTIPQTVGKVLLAAHDDHSSAADIAAIVETDPPVAARLLQITNSPAFGLPNQVDSVQQAIALLGVRQTYLAVLSSAVINIAQSAKGFDYDSYWECASFTASAARNIAERCALDNKTGIFTAGLLADIGRFALSQLVPNPYHIIHGDMPQGHLIVAEEDLLGVAHPEAGYILATHWSLPADIAEAIRFHHRPLHAMDYNDVVTAVALAAIMADAHLQEVESDPDYFKPYRKVLNILGISPHDAAEVYAETRESETAGASF